MTSYERQAVRQSDHSGSSGVAEAVGTGSRYTAVPRNVRVSQMLGLKAVHTSTLGMATVVSQGLPTTALKRVLSEISRDPRIRQRVSDQVISRATLKRRGLRLKQEESGRLERIARLMATAEWVWDDKAEAQAFMATRNKALNDLSPIDMATSDAGVRAVEEVLNRIYYGLPV